MSWFVNDLINDMSLWRPTVPQSSPSSKRGGRIDGERVLPLAEGGAEEWVEMDLPIDGDGMGNTDQVVSMLGAFWPSIDDEKEDCKHREQY